MSNFERKQQVTPATFSFDQAFPVWMLHVFEDSCDVDALIQRLDGLGWDYAGLFHASENCAPHHHIVCVFEEGVNHFDFQKALGFQGISFWPWYSERAALRYLCHKDHDYLFQYNPASIYGPLAAKARAVCFE